MPDQKDVARSSSFSGSAVRPSGPLRKVRPAGAGARRALSMFRKPRALSPTTSPTLAAALLATNTTLCHASLSGVIGKSSANVSPDALHLRVIERVRSPTAWGHVVPGPNGCKRASLARWVYARLSLKR
eukprot:15454101-Alexandrium_andersonii.AAC.2